ncbi:MAG: acetate--CoA ligase family protein [Candidatus Bipolaricaulota bacterium]|nr:acetate--CoA ligase family protein [Candidatus Bipolaricaulota bacterium]MCS7274696.1 acetate--CoA ligase family protein [Candidatus Bipolaricaulota bacterium]MDW8111627.1 acetate--CoA ligase family protein [Candidatus Bipolaricaulota bacterium]MDW8329360.1 acetate--CoA ligase family protein [Candidatus Bipolaricaulota bacterium]
MSAHTPDIKLLFEPRTIAVIGASHDPNKIGYKIVQNIVSNGYGGRVFPVNPKGGEIVGLRAYASVRDIPDEIDVALIVVPAKAVFQTVQECAAHGVKFVPIISSGFSEVGNLEEERKIVAYARAHGMRVLGPNIFGLYSVTPSLNASFGPREIPKGNVAIVTQSGALGVAMIGKAAAEKMGLSAIISVGNKADIDEADLLEYLVPHAETRVILMYIEGVKNGERLVTSLKRASKQKPIIVIKAGRSRRGAIAAASHTGSLAGATEVFDAIMKQCGVLRAESIREAFHWCKFLATSVLPRGAETVIITNGGGVGVLATDACETYSVELYDDLQVLEKIFSPVTPEFGSTKNPIDLTGQATAADYDQALAAAQRSDAIHAVIALYCETALFDIASFEPMIERNFRAFQAQGKPVVFSALGGEKVERLTETLRHRGVPIFADVTEAVSCLGALYEHHRYVTQPEEPVESFELDTSALEKILEAARRERRGFLLAHEAQQLLRIARIPVPRSAIARTLEEAVRYAEEIGYPVVLKVVSRDILHKSDVGGVALDLDNAHEVADAYGAILHNCRTYKPGAVIDGIEVSRQVPPGTQIIIGARRDPSFGPIVMVGLGGIYVEVMKDVSFRALPIGRQDALNMLKELKSYPLLLGVRGEERRDVDAVIEVLLRVGALLLASEGISDIEINPLIVYEHGRGGIAVDARVLLAEGGYL